MSITWMHLLCYIQDGVIDIRRWKRDTGIQYRHEKKEDTAGFIPKLIARPEYGTVYQHQGMLLQNLHHRSLYIVIQLPHLKDLDRKYLVFLIVIITEYAEPLTLIL